jgi:hypothetical protein
MITISAHDTFLYSMEKGGQRAKQWRDRETETERETECCSKRVTTWAINLTIGQIFMAARERIILDLIKINIKISKNLDGIVFLLSWYYDFSSICQTTDMSHVSSFCRKLRPGFT